MSITTRTITFTEYSNLVDNFAFVLCIFCCRPINSDRTMEHLLHLLATSYNRIKNGIIQYGLKLLICVLFSWHVSGLQHL